MHRPGCDPDAMTERDFLCDFCARDWSVAQPFVEGHHGSCVCGDCLRAALAAGEPESPVFRCNLCLEDRSDLALSRPPAALCRRCRDRSARALERDPESGWSR
jgi:hypothetical protein